MPNEIPMSRDNIFTPNQQELPVPATSVIVITFQRDDAVLENLAHLTELIGSQQDCEMVLVDNNPDDVDRSHFIENFARPVYVKCGENRGVSGGRNAGIRAATGNFLIFVDDDAFVHPANFLELFQNAFAENPKLGIVAVKSINFYSQKVQPHEFPHTDKSLPKDETFKTFRYIGVCHAFRKSMIDKLGIYDEDFFYGAEEFDLSYRAINAGYEMLYLPKIWVFHKKAEGGRLTPLELQKLLLTNKLKVAVRYLPWYILPINVAMWLAFSLHRSKYRLNVLTPFKTVLKWAGTPAAKRQPLTPAALSYIRSVGGNVLK